MPHLEIAECPSCGKRAYGRKEITEKFGYRYDDKVPQSYCKDCRAKNQKENKK